MLNAFTYKITSFMPIRLIGCTVSLSVKAVTLLQRPRRRAVGSNPHKIINLWDTQMNCSKFGCFFVFIKLFSLYIGKLPTQTNAIIKKKMLNVVNNIMINLVVEIWQVTYT